jgi:hypothetical protein
LFQERLVAAQFWKSYNSGIRIIDAVRRAMLRVGIMLDSYVSSAWVAKVIEDIQASEFTQVELVILDTPARESVRSLRTRLSHRWKFSLFRRYERWDYRRNKGEHDALAPTDVSPLLRQVPSILIHSSHEGATRDISETDPATILNYRLDVLIRFTSGALRGAILRSARFGVWSFRFGQSDDPASPPLFEEIFRDDPVSESTLRIQTNSSEGERVIYRSQAASGPTSLYFNRNQVYWKTAEFALRRLQDLHLHGFAYIESLPSYRKTGADTSGLHPRPGAFHMFFFMARYWIRRLQDRVRSPRSGPRTKWCIAIRRRTEVHRFDDPENYRLMRSPKDRFYADPFLAEKEGKTFLFFEDYRYAEGRAVISCCELDPDGLPGPPFEVLRLPNHLSYPLVFEDAGEMYMIPETRDNRTVELYRATSFPHAWIHEAVLFNDIHAVDSTIQKINDKYWMFASVSNGKYSNCDEVSLFFADALRGPWTPHPCNPLLSDVMLARPAGMLFYDQGRLIRPSQDCSKAYGYALVFSEVLKLSETEYEERPIGRLDPLSVKYNSANHTYNRTEKFEVIDRNFPPRIADEDD